MKTFKMTIAAVCLVLVTGCNTVQGIGKDVQIGGRVISGAAETAEK